MNKTLFLYLFCFSLSIQSFSQSNLEIDKLIAHLSWESINLVHEGHELTPFETFSDPFVSNLVKIGAPCSERLLMSITKPEKTVIIHMILTKIFEPEKNYICPFIPFYQCSYVFKEYKRLIGFHCVFNGLIWNLQGSYQIEKTQIDRIKLYWDNKIHRPNNSFTIKAEDILSEIQKMDSTSYSCSKNRTYKNNSSLLEFHDIELLFSTSYPNPLYNKVFNILGNDSIMYQINNSTFSIDYFADGIEFLFKDHELRQLFIKPAYEGSLINGIKMTDNREAVKKKIADPEEYHESSYYSYDWLYPKYGLYISFGDANRIIDLMIDKKSIK
jgi:hypothetical protein